MNNQLIKKIIKAHNTTCPEFVYSNPLLDKNVAIALAVSFMKILDESRKDNNLVNHCKISVLTNIRKMCQVESKNHLRVDENVSGLLTECYLQHMTEGTTTRMSSVNKTLDDFLMRKLKEFDFPSKFEKSFNPDLVQALLNLNEYSPQLNMLSKGIMNWKVSVNNSTILKHMWSDDNFNKDPDVCNDISIKRKNEIESLLLSICQSILENRDSNIDNMFTENIIINDLIKKCSIASSCFQICCSILNSLFIMIHFDPQLLIFISKFINKVNETCAATHFTHLYPVHMNHVVLLLNFDFHVLPYSLKSTYIESACNYLNKLKRNSKHDLIMLLSHFPQWFDIYFTHHHTNI